MNGNTTQLLVVIMYIIVYLIHRLLDVFGY